MVVGGFPSPADDYIEAGLDLNSLLIPHPISTFLWRVSGEAMQGLAFLMATCCWWIAACNRGRGGWWWLCLKGPSP